MEDGWVPEILYYSSLKIIYNFIQNGKKKFFILRFLVFSQ